MTYWPSETASYQRTNLTKTLSTDSCNCGALNCVHVPVQEPDTLSTQNATDIDLPCWKHHFWDVFKLLCLINCAVYLVWTYHLH